MLKKWLIFFIIPFIFCACSKNNFEEITFSSWGSITETQILDKIIDNFERQNPNIKVKFLHIPQNYFQKLHLLFASSTEPDVIFINDLYLPFYADRLEDLSGIVNVENFYPQSIKSFSQEGKLLAVPRDISNFVLYYNKAIIPYDIDKNWSFETFDNLVRKYSDINHYGISFERDIFYAEPYIMTFGYEEGIKYYKNMEGKYAPTPAQIGSLTTAQMFLEGRLTFYMSGRWMYPKISETAKFPFGVIIFPGKVPCDGSGWAISKKSKHKNAAKLFVKYLSSKESIDYFTETGLIVPARIDSSKKLDNENEKAFLRAIESSIPMDIDKTFPKKRDKLNKELFDK